MEEILKGKIQDKHFDTYTNEMVIDRNYHIYKKGGTIFVDAPFPVKYMKKLRMLLMYNNIYYWNIIIGKPYI